MDDQRAEHIAPKRLPQRNDPKQLQTHYLPTYDVENTNDTKRFRTCSQAADCSLANRKDTANDT